MSNDSQTIYFSSSPWRNKPIIRNTPEEQQIAIKALRWDWSNDAKQALTEFKRLDHVMLTPEQVAETMEKEWGESNSFLEEFQRELGGIYISAKLGIDIGDGILFGLRDIYSRADFNEDEIPEQEFFFENPDWKFVSFRIGHRGEIFDGNKIYNNAKAFIEGIVHLNKLICEIAQSEFYYLRISGLSFVDNQFLRDLIEADTSAKEIVACRDEANFLYKSNDTVYSFSAIGFEDGRSKMLFEIYSNYQIAIRGFFENMPTLANFKYNFLTKTQNHYIWHETYVIIEGSNAVIHPDEEERVAVNFDVTPKSVSVNGKIRDHTTIWQAYLNSRAIGAHGFVTRRLLT